MIYRLIEEAEKTIKYKGTKGDPNITHTSYDLTWIWFYLYLESIIECTIDVIKMENIEEFVKAEWDINALKKALVNFTAKAYKAGEVDKKTTTIATIYFEIVSFFLIIPLTNFKLYKRDGSIMVGFGKTVHGVSRISGYDSEEKKDGTYN